MALTTAELISYLKADSADSADITSMVTAAQRFVKTQTGKTLVVVPAVAPATVSTTAAIDTDELYILAVRRFVARMYEHRGDNLPERSAKEDPSVQMLINHIATCGEYV